MNPRKVQQLCQFLREEVHGQLDYFSRLWEGYGDEDNPEPPHRQRTVVNRLMGYALFLGMPMDKKKDSAAGLLTLRSWQKRLGPLRDLDVMRQWIGKCAKEAGTDGDRAAQVFHEALTAERAELLTIVRLDAKSLPGARTRAVVPSVVAQFEEQLARIEADPKILDEYAAIEQVAGPWRARLERLHHDQSDKKIHSFRVTNKRLRFVLELLSRSEGKRTPFGRQLNKAATTALATHNTLGNLSDLLMVNNKLRLLRARWAADLPDLHSSAASLERGRLSLEAGELDRWFEYWPKLADPSFVPQRKQPPRRASNSPVG